MASSLEHFLGRTTGQDESSERAHETPEKKSEDDEAETDCDPEKNAGDDLSSIGKLNIRVKPENATQTSYQQAIGKAHCDRDIEDGPGPDATAAPAAAAAAADFEVKFDGESDPRHPHNRALGHKWAIVLIVASCSLCVACASSLYASTYAQLDGAFGVGDEAATLGLTTFVLGLACGPLLLSPLSEFYGRRGVYVCSYGMFVLWLVPCARAPNLATMLAARFLDGLAGSAFLSVAGGTVGDMFPRHQLSMPMMVYTASPFIGPQIGPLLGGFINYYTDWRWSFYVLIIWAGVEWALIILFVPETYAPVLLRRKAQELRKETADPRWRAPIENMNRSVAKTVMWSCIRPFELLFLEPMCLNLCLLSAFLLGIVYLFFGAIPLIFERNYGFNEWQSGLAFLGLFVGIVIGVCFDVVTRWNYDRLVRNNGGVSEPEFRLPPTIMGAIIVPIGLFGFAWTSYPFIHWIVPIIFSGIFGFGNILCFSGIFTFLVEAYPLFAASALAANSFARSVFAASFPLFGVQMYNTLGFQWASSLLAFIGVAMAPFPLLFFRTGKQIRRRSRFTNDR